MLLPTTTACPMQCAVATTSEAIGDYSADTGGGTPRGSRRLRQPGQRRRGQCTRVQESTAAAAVPTTDHEAMAAAAEKREAKRALKHQRRMTVAGAVVGGIVADPAGAVALGVAQNALNDPKLKKR
jgi:hypothetical protein